MNTKATGYILGAVAAATYGMNPLFALPLYKAGMDPDSVLFLRYLLAIPILGIMLKSRGRSFRLQRKEIFPLIVMGLLVAISSLTLFQSYNYMEAGIASTLLFVYPIMVALIMAVVFKERLTLQTILCIGLALGGIAMLYQNGEGATLNLTGVLLVMASALSYAIYIVGVNQSTLKDVATLKLTFYVLLFGLSLFLVRVDFGRSLHIVNEWYTWLNISVSRISDSHVIPLYNQSNTIYRFHTDGHSRSFGTRNRCLFRSIGIRRIINHAHYLRNHHDYCCSHLNNCR